MRFEELLQFAEHDMRMSHVYQPVMLRELLTRGGRATREEIARALLNEDRPRTPARKSSIIFASRNAASELQCR